MLTSEALGIVDLVPEPELSAKMWEIVARRLGDEVHTLRDRCAAAEHELEHVRELCRNNTSFIPLTKEEMNSKPNCDMRSGPCSCGAWH